MFSTETESFDEKKEHEEKIAISAEIVTVAMDIFLLLKDCDHVGRCQLKINLSDPYSVFFVSIFFFHLRIRCSSQMWYCHICMVRATLLFKN